MNEFVKGFKDRKSTYTGRKKINVIEQTAQANGTSTMLVNIARNDGTVTQEGTKLDANSMNEAVLDLVYYELYGIEFINFPYFINVIGEQEGNINFQIKFHGERLYPKVSSPEYSFYNSYSYNDSTKILNISLILFEEIEKSDYEYDFMFNFSLYSDAGCNNYVTSINRYCHYTPSSTSPSD